MVNKMDEQAKIIIYRQLLEFEAISKLKKKKLIPWEEYNELDGVDAIKYALKYREECTKNIEKKIEKGKVRPFCLELPDIDLAGANLENVYLYDFMPGYAKERHNGKKIFVSASINLRDTKCVINMASIKPIIVSSDR